MRSSTAQAVKSLNQALPQQPKALTSAEQASILIEAQQAQTITINSVPPRPYSPHYLADENPAGAGYSDVAETPSKKPGF